MRKQTAGATLNHENLYPLTIARNVKFAFKLVETVDGRLIVS